MKTKRLFTISCLVLCVSCCYSQTETTPEYSSSSSDWKPIIIDDTPKKSSSSTTKSSSTSNNDIIWYYSGGTQSSSKVTKRSSSSATASVQTFRPVSATLTDSQGSFTSTNFNHANLYLTDNKNNVRISIAGDNLILTPIGNGNDTYQCQVKHSTGTLKMVAYRSSKSQKIYLVVCTTTMNEQKIVINYKP